MIALSLPILLSVLTPQAQAEDCEVGALMKALDEASPQSTPRAYSALAACDGAMAKRAAKVALPRMIAGKDAYEATSAAISAAPVAVAPEKGYGQASGTDPVRVKKSELPRGRTWNQGEGVRLPGPDGTTTVLWVSKAKGAWVWLSRDHPLAGKTLVFSIDIVNVRQATQAESDHGHAHGHDGHEHH